MIERQYFEKNNHFMGVANKLKKHFLKIDINYTLLCCMLEFP